MVSLTKESIKNHLLKLSKDVEKRNQELHGLCNEAIESISKEEDVIKIMQNLNIIYPFIVALDTMKKVPLYVLDCIRFFLCRSSTKEDYLHKIGEVIVSKSWDEDSKLKILQFILYIVGNRTINDKILVDIFVFVVRMKESSKGNISSSSEVICKQMILIIFDRHLNDLKNMLNFSLTGCGNNLGGGLFNVNLVSEDSEYNKSKADVLKIFDVIINLAEKEPGKKIIYFLDILELAVENSLVFEKMYSKLGVGDLSKDDPLRETHRHVLKLVKKNISPNTIKISLGIFLKYVRSNAYREDLQAIFCEIIRVKENYLQILNFFDSLDDQGYNYFSEILLEIMRFLLIKSKYLDMRLKLCKKICDHLYQNRITSDTYTGNTFISPSNAISSVDSIKNGASYALKEPKDMFLGFTKIFLEFFEEPGIDKDSLIYVSNIIINWSTINNQRDTYVFYIKKLVEVESKASIGTILRTSKYAKESWNSIFESLNQECWRYLAEFRKCLDDESIKYFIKGLKNNACKENIEFLVSIFNNNLKVIVAEQNIDMIEICFDLAGNFGTCEQLGSLALEYCKIIKHQYLCVNDNQVVCEISFKMETIPFSYLKKFVNQHSCYSEGLKILLEMLKILDDCLRYSWLIVFEIALETSEKKNHLSSDVILQNFYVIQWIVEEHIRSIDEKYIPEIFFILRNIANDDLNITLNVLNLYQEIGEFLIGKDLDLIKSYFSNILSFLNDDRHEIIETVLYQIFDLIKYYRYLPDYFAEKEILCKIFECLRRFGGQLFEPYFEESKKDITDNTDHEIHITLKDADKYTPNARVADDINREVFLKNNEIFFLILKYINDYLDKYGLFYYKNTYLDFITKCLITKIEFYSYKGKEIQYINRLALICINTLSIYLAKVNGKKISNEDDSKIHDQKVSTKPNKSYALVPFTIKTFPDLKILENKRYVDLSLKIPLNYYEEPVYINLITLYYSVNLNSTLIESFCNFLHRILSSSNRNMPTLCQQAFTICDHILRNHHYLKIINIYTALLNQNPDAMDKLVCSYSNEKSCNKLYQEVLSNILETADWNRSVESVKLVSKKINTLKKFETFLFFSRKILNQVISRSQEKTLIDYLYFYKNLVNSFCTNIRKNIDNPAYYKAYELGDFEKVNEELLNQIFGTDGMANSHSLQDIPSAIQSSISNRDNSTTEKYPQQVFHTECCKFLFEAYKIIADLSGIKDGFFKEHLSVMCYNVLFESLSLKVVYNIFRDCVKSRLLEFCENDAVYGNLYSKTKKEEIYLLLDMLISSGDRKMIELMLKELIECLSCKDLRVIKSVQSCLKIIYH